MITWTTWWWNCQHICDRVPMPELSSSAKARNRRVDLWWQCLSFFRFFFEILMLSCCSRPGTEELICGDSIFFGSSFRFCCIVDVFWNNQLEALMEDFEWQRLFVVVFVFVVVFGLWMFLRKHRTWGADGRSWVTTTRSPRIADTWSKRTGLSH